MPIFEPFFRQRRIIRRQITSIFSKILEKVLLILFAIIPIRCLLGKQSIVFDFIPHAGTQSEFFASFADSVVQSTPCRAASPATSEILSRISRAILPSRRSNATWTASTKSPLGEISIVFPWPPRRAPHRRYIICTAYCMAGEFERESFSTTCNWEKATWPKITPLFFI